MYKAKSDIPTLNKFLDFVRSIKNTEGNDFTWFVDNISHTANGYAEKCNALLATELDQNDVIRHFESTVSKLKMKIRALFEKPRSNPLSPVHYDENTIFSVTSEFLSAVEQFNGQIRSAEALFQRTIREFSPSMTSVKEAKSISSGRILTHSAPDPLMYAILKKGALSSVSEQRKNYGSSRRPHGIGLESSDLEIHGISFEIDSIYSTFSSSESRHPSLQNNIALIFSENQMLENRQFAIYDGMHLFDGNYTGTSKNAPGLTIDLSSTPFMIMVTARKKLELIKFLIEDSAFKGILAGLDSTSRQQWLDDHLLVVSKIDNYAITPKDKTQFSKLTGKFKRKGYVETTGNSYELKGGMTNTRRFVPTSSY